MLKFRGSSNFRQRVALATISGRAIRIDDIRANSETPGLRDFEACFLRLIEKVTNGCVVEINETGAERLAVSSEAHVNDAFFLSEGSSRCCRNNIALSPWHYIWGLPLAT